MQKCANGFMPQVSLQELVAAVKAGDRLASFPTDTVPALAARPDRAALIFEAKQRRLDKPLILMAATAQELWEYVQGSEAERSQWEKLTQRHWPGALTLVLPAGERVPPALNPLNPTTLGVRVPNHAIAQAILAATGPLATTSANLSGAPALQNMADIEAQFPTVLTLTADALATISPTAPTVAASGVPSTVVRWTGSTWEVLRQGAITLEQTL